MFVTRHKDNLSISGMIRGYTVNVLLCWNPQWWTGGAWDHGLFSEVCCGPVEVNWRREAPDA